jgi:hypothetical protein
MSTFRFLSHSIFLLPYTFYRMSRSLLLSLSGTLFGSEVSYPILLNCYSLSSSHAAVSYPTWMKSHLPSHVVIIKCFIWVLIVCMYAYNRGGPHSALALRPLLIYCASPLISPLLIPHFEWSAGLYLWGRHRGHLVPWKLAQVTKS